MLTIVESVTDYSVPVISHSQDEVFQPDSVHYVDNVVATLWRELSWWPDGNFYRARTRARTTTNQCVDQVNVWAAHELLTSGFWVEQFNSGNYHSSGPCHNDSSIASMAAGLYYPGQRHRSRGIHVIYVNGQRHAWNETGPERMIP